MKLLRGFMETSQVAQNLRNKAACFGGRSLRTTEATNELSLLVIWLDGTLDTFFWL